MKRIKNLVRVPVETLMAALMLNLSPAKAPAAENKFTDRTTNNIELIDNFNSNETSAQQAEPVRYQNGENTGYFNFRMNKRSYLLYLQNTEGDKKTFDRIILVTKNPNDPSKIWQDEVKNILKTKIIINGSDAKKSINNSEPIMLIESENEYGNRSLSYSPEAVDFLLKMLKSPDNKTGCKIKNYTYNIYPAIGEGLTYFNTKNEKISTVNTQNSYFGNNTCYKKIDLTSGKNNYTIRFYNTNNNPEDVEVVTVEGDHLPRMRVVNIIKGVYTLEDYNEAVPILKFEAGQIDLAKDYYSDPCCSIIDNELYNKLVNIYLHAPDAFNYKKCEKYLFIK